jgi:outer membrane protein
MKNKIRNPIGFVFLLLVGLNIQAQTKKWTIEECVNYALEHNISIKQSELDIKLATIDKTAAIGNFLPSINAGASHSWNIGLNQNITTGLLENQTTQFTSASLNSNIDIYNGLQNQNRLRRAKMAIIASQYQLAKMQDDISLFVANSFLDILFNKENLKVQQNQLEYDTKQLTRTEELVNSGSVARGDLLDMKATIASDNQKIVAAENALLLSKLSLVQLLQLDDFQNFDIVDQDYATQDSPTLLETPQSIFEKAKQERIEMKIAKSNLELSQKDIKIARGAYHPSLSGFYSFSTRASYSDRIVGVDTGGNPILAGPLPLFDQFSNNKGHNFGLQLNIPILNGFSARSNVERSKVNAEKSKVAFNQAETDLEKNVYTAFTNAKGALKTYESAQLTLAARQEAFNYAKEKYNVGLMNAFDYNQSQTLFANAQSDAIRAKYDYIFKVKVVELYFGIPIIKKQ